MNKLLQAGVLCHPLIENKHCDDFWLIGTFLRFKAAFGWLYFVCVGGGVGGQPENTFSLCIGIFLYLFGM